MWSRKLAYSFCMLDKRSDVTSPDGMTNAQSFMTTHWSMVRSAGGESSPDAQSALETLCRAYWYPLYSFVRRCGHDTHDAEDLTQGFFAWLLESEHLGRADPEHGRFRSFLLVRLKHYLSDERKKARALKRGGGQTLLSLDTDSAETRYGMEPATNDAPERVFDQRWAAMVMQRAVTRLRDEYVAADREQLFDELKHFQSGEDPSVTYRETAARLGLSESAVKSAIFRLRQRHRHLLREEIAHTVSTPAEADEEIRYLISVLGGA